MAIAIAVTLAMVTAAMGIAFFVVLGLTFTDHFTIDRLLGVVGALGAVGWLAGLIIRLLRNWIGGS